MSPSPVPAAPAADRLDAPSHAPASVGPVVARRTSAPHDLYLVPPFPFSGPVVGARQGRGDGAH